MPRSAGPPLAAGFALGDLLHDIEAGKSLKIPGRPADDDKWGVIKVSAMTWGEFDERYEIEPGDLLLSREMRANVSVQRFSSIGETGYSSATSQCGCSQRPGVGRRWLRCALDRLL